MRPLERIALFRDMVTYGPAVSAGDVLFFLHGLEASLRSVIAEQKAARDEQIEGLKARVAELEGKFAACADELTSRAELIACDCGCGLRKPKGARDYGILVAAQAIRNAGGALDVIAEQRRQREAGNPELLP